MGHKSNVTKGRVHGGWFVVCKVCPYLTTRQFWSSAIYDALNHFERSKEKDATQR